MNIHAWHGWTQGAEVEVAVDHKAVVQILKSKGITCHWPHRVVNQEIRPPTFQPLLW